MVGADSSKDFHVVLPFFQMPKHLNYLNHLKPPIGSFSCRYREIGRLPEGSGDYSVCSACHSTHFTITIQLTGHAPHIDPQAESDHVPSTACFY